MSQPQKVLIEGVWRPLMTSAGQPAKECCCVEAGCCMYPASGLEDTYEAADLPNEVLLYGEIAERDGTNYGPVMAVVPGFGEDPVSVGVYYTEDPGLSGNFYWQITVDEADYVSASDCLIQGDGNLTPGDDVVEDQFEPTYTIGWTFVVAQSVEVERNSLCGWSYGPFPLPENPSDGDVFIPEASLFYFPRPQDPVPGVVYDVWSLEFTVAEAYDPGWGDPVIWNITQSGFFRKTPHQESPAGDYETTSGSLFTDVTVT